MINGRPLGIKINLFIWIPEKLVSKEDILYHKDRLDRVRRDYRPETKGEDEGVHVHVGLAQSDRPPVQREKNSPN